MHRLFGKKKPTAPRATLDDASSNLERRGEGIDGKIAKLDGELQKYKAQLKKMKKGTGAYRQTQQRAMRVLKQKKMYEKQRDSLYQQSFNIDQAKFATENLKDNAAVVEAMKDASKTLKKQYKEINIDEIEDIHDDMEEMLELGDEINEVMGRSYGVSEEIDEDDLMQELDALEDELEMEDPEEVPSYLQDSAPVPTKLPEAPAGVEVDAHGLPLVPEKVNA